ncbi:hypothetical protein GCM10017783_22330 [Deinococcus piscis]|uniref:HTH marR-type domain-containing protein n=2 Tax=Deinococcus piscis TaxID=394230 RepID=A0ABQ3K9H3_9DEIO|nr:hypothetical protein GCM10017783_22330 [Deinococcus piscis]
MPRMTGRVLGALLQAPASGYTPAELAAELQVSRAAISGALQQLNLMGLSESVPNPGERAGRYRVRPGAWASVTEQGNRKLQTLHDLANEGLQVLPEGADPAALEEMRDFYALWLELFPNMLREWQERRKV